VIYFTLRGKSLGRMRLIHRAMTVVLTAWARSDQHYLIVMCGRARLSSDVSEIKLVFSIPPHRRQRLNAVLAALPVLISCYRTVSKPPA
jgi:hypothetical protein